MLKAMNTHQNDIAETKSFSVLANESLLSVRSSIGIVLESCGIAVQEVQRSHKRLEIDKKLAWRLAKVFQSDDPYTAARYVPGPSAMKGFFARAEKEAVPKAMIENARSAIDAFDKLIETQAENRRSFELMLSGHTTTALEETDVIQRKEATTALSYVWGVLAKAQLRTYIVRPSDENPGLLDFASIGGFVGLQWIRPDVGWVVHRTNIHDDVGKIRSGPIGTPLDPRVETGAVPLLRAYCSKALPPMRRVEVKDGFVIDELIESNVGKSSATTCLTGEIYRSLVPGFRDEQNMLGCAVLHARTPCEVLLYDMLIHKDIEMNTPPALKVFGDFEYGSEKTPIACRRRHQLMSWMGIESLGTGLARSYTPHLPRYTTMIEQCMEGLSWIPDEFSMYRVVIPYPVTPSTIAIQYELPDTP